MRSFYRCESSVFSGQVGPDPTHRDDGGGAACGIAFAWRESGSRKAGEDAGDHVLEVDITLDELADILAEELELLATENGGRSRIVSPKDR